MRGLTINLHAIERCNYACSYCFAHWAQKDDLFSDDEAFAALLDSVCEQALAMFDSVTINFAGGEPALFRNLDRGLEVCKRRGVLTSVISNGLIFSRYSAERLVDLFDIIGISVDSICDETNASIGRIGKNGKVQDYGALPDRMKRLKKLRSTIRTKINTVVSGRNWREQLVHFVASSEVDRWKILRVLPINNRELISQARFDSFVERNSGYPGTVVEDNDHMIGSYVMINPAGQLFQSVRDENGVARYVYWSLIDGGLADGLKYIGFDERKYERRYLPNLHSGMKASLAPAALVGPAAVL